MALCALPVAVVGFSGTTVAETLSGPLAALWLGLLPVALYKRWATVALCLWPAALLFITLFAMPFNSPAFIIDFWTSALMLGAGAAAPANRRKRTRARPHFKNDFHKGLG